MKQAILLPCSKMRFIHTADWHLGNQMHEIDRKCEYEVFLKWLKRLIVEKQADALVISGDIFDTVNPPVESRRLYYTFLASLVDTCCQNVIIIGGNHDSAVMLDSAKELLEVLNIRVVGSINNLSPSQMCFELLDSKKSPCGICIALPFIREVELKNLLDNNSPNEKISDSDLYSLAYKKIYDALYAEAEQLRAGRALPIIATGHLYAANLEGRLSEKKSNEKSDDGVKVLDVLGTLGFVPATVFPEADYIALGHIHYSTMVDKNPRIRYSGSPFVMGFDEADMSHYVLSVEINKNSDEKAFEVEKVATPVTYRYKRLTGSLAELKNEISDLSEKVPDEKIFLELCYKKELGVSAQNYLADAILSLPENIHVVSWKVIDAEKYLSITSNESFDVSEIQNLDNKEIFTRLILSKSGFPLDSQEAKAALEKFLPLFLSMQNSQE